MKQLTIIAAVLVQITPWTVYAESPISVQGSMRTSGGVPVTGSHDLVFRVYSAETGGSSLWEEAHSAVSFTNGIYSAVLGSTSPLTGIFSSADDRWLGVTLDAGTEFSPRQKLTATPLANYAIKAANAGQLDGATSTSFAQSLHSHPAMTTGRIDGLSPNGPQFGAPSGISTANSDEELVETLTPNTSITISNFAIKCGAPGSGETRTFTLRVNGVDSALSATVSGFTGIANSGTATVTIPAGSEIVLKCDASGAAASTFVRFGYQVY